MHFVASYMLSTIAVHLQTFFIMLVIVFVSFCYYCFFVRPNAIRAQKDKIVVDQSACPTPETVLLSISSAVGNITADTESQLRMAVKSD